MSAVVLALVAIAGTAAFDVYTRSRIHRTQAELRTNQAALGHTRRTLRGTETLVAEATTTRNTLQTRVVWTDGLLGKTHTNLDAVNQAIWFQGVNLNSLRLCLGGVRQAYGQIAGGHQADAIGALTNAAGPCRDAQHGNDTGQAYPFDFPDPFVTRVGGTYFAYATNAAAGNIQVIRSDDLAHWTTVGDALPKLPRWATPGAVWAPSVLQRGNAFVLYYSTVVATTHSQCISTAVSASPAGPFVDDSALPIVCQLGLGGSIDPAPFVDATGTPYLSWRSIRGNGHPSTLWSQRLSPDGRSVVGDAAVPLLNADRPWEAGTVEGPTMATLGGQLYLFYSANEWTTASYAVGLARCASPLGPCTKLGTGPILAAQNGIAGPGGQSVFFDAQGNPWLAFHAWRPSAIGFPHSRMLYLRRLDLSTGTPVVMAPP